MNEFDKTTENIIEVKNLRIEFPLLNGTIHAVNGADFTIPRHSITALVGESGSGKSTMATALINMVSSPGVVAGGEILYNGVDVLKLDKKQLREYRWEQVSMVFQAAQNTLNPLMTIGEQIIETVHAHKPGMEQAKVLEIARRLFDYVRLEPERALKAYPHEMSGGMKQRVMIVFAMLLQPQLMILDEPSTALDVITQDYIFEILGQIFGEMDLTMLLLTHDIAIVAKFAQRVSVMYAGNIVETGSVEEVFRAPLHEYTRQLIEAAPSLIGSLDERAGIVGSPPDLITLPKGCAFCPRCARAMPICAQQAPQSCEARPGHFVACHLYTKEASV